jgi:predicted nucleotidyltransferase
MIREPVIDERRTILEAELKRCLDLLVEVYQPDAVLLFGSVASNSIHEWSDLDLVIIKETDRRFLDRIRDVIELVQPQVGMDIIVYTPQEIAQLSEERAFIRDEILAKGRVLYAK